MIKIPEDITKRLEVLKTIDIKFENFGIESNFIEAHDIKSQIISLIESVVDLILKYCDEVPDPVVQHYLITINSKLVQLEERANQIITLIGGGIHKPDFPSQRNIQLDEFRKIKKSTIFEIYAIKRNYELQDLKGTLLANTDLAENVKTSNKNLQETQRILDDSKRILSETRDVSFIKSLKESAGTFEKLRLNHSIYERNWFIAFITFATIIVGLIIYIISIEYTYQNVTESIALLIKKILILSVPIIGMRVSLKRHNLERNLKIIYDHRATILEQYKYFENSIGDDKGAKSLFRLEIAKYLFSDPITGYIQDNSSPDVSVNPIVSITDKYFSKIS